MKIAGINNNISFGSLHFGPLKKEHDQNIINPNFIKLNNLAQNADVYIESDDFLLKKGNDYIVTTPVLKVLVSPLRHPKTQGLLKKNNSNIFSLSYIFRPEESVNSGNDFLSYLEDAVNTVSK